MSIIRRQIEDLTNWPLRVFLLVYTTMLMRSRSDEPAMLYVNLVVNGLIQIPQSRREEPSMTRVVEVWVHCCRVTVDMGIAYWLNGLSVRLLRHCSFHVYLDMFMRGFSLTSQPTVNCRINLVHARNSCLLEAQRAKSLMRAGRSKEKKGRKRVPSLSVLLNRDSKCSDDDTWRFLVGP